MKLTKSNHVTFKSVEPYFTVEMNGKKPNTEREIDMTDERFQRLAKWKIDGLTGNEYIEIYEQPRIMHDTGRFVRQITDISFWKNICIISWKHQ